MNKKKGIISLILTVVLIGLLGFTTIVGFGDAHIGASKNIKLGLDLAGGVSITYQVKNDNPTSEEMSDTIYKLQRRVEQYSTEASVYQEGDDRINIEIPGVTDANKILDELGKPGSLEFQDPNGETVITGSDVKTATVKTGQDDLNNKEYSVELTLNDDGTKKFADATTEFVGQQISIIYDGETISAPSVKQAITGGQAYITGNFTYEEAENLASTIRIGGLKLELEELRSNVVGAQLGAQAISTSVKAGIAGLVLVFLLMCFLYLLPGLASSLALVIYTGLVLVILNAFDITLTLPGLAGIILGIGMAVDGNVIIYTRIREEIGAGKSVESAILSGYNKATSSIVDGNVTTLIAALVLYIFGTGPVKGFATTLAVGNIVSIFTSLVITKVIMKLLYNFGIRDAKWYGKNVYRKTLDVLSIKKWAAIGSAVVIAAGIITMAVQAGLGNRALNFSLEFVGGSTTTFTFDKEYTAEEIEDNIIPVIRDAAGITEVQQQKVADSTQVSFKTSDLSLEQREAIENAVTAKYPIKDGTIVETDTISSSVSATVKRDAILSVILATICMLIYIFVRFRDIRFALAAVLALLHDVLVVIAFYAFARIPVGTTFIACMLTIVGYSINGTIIIFDRIREQLKTANSKTNITELVNSSITSTMSRTVYTSITTLIMLIVLFIMGVTSVKEFTLPLIVGIVVGAYSSVCLTSAMWYVMGGKKRGVVEENNKKAASKKEVFEDGSQV